MTALLRSFRHFDRDVHLLLVTTPHQRRYVFSAMVALWPLAGFAGSLIGGFLPGLFAAALELPHSMGNPRRPSRWRGFPISLTSP